MAKYVRGLSAKNIFDIDVKLSRLAADILGLAAGDSLRLLDAGRLQFGTGVDMAFVWDDADTRFRLYDAGADPVFEYLVTATRHGEFTMYSNCAYNGAIAPMLNLNQLSTGEAAIRFWRQGDPATAALLGFVASETHRHWALFFESGAGGINPIVVHEGESGGYIGIGGLAAEDHPAAQLEVRGRANVLQFLAKGFSTQTASILEVQKSDGTVLMAVPNASRSSWAYGMDLPNNSDIRMKNAAGDYYSVVYVSSGNVLTIDGDALAISLGGSVSIAADKKITFNPSAADIDCILPATDARGQIGNATYRFSLVRAVTITSGDFVFENGWKMTEAERLGLGEGIALVKPNGEVAQVWR